MFTRLVITLAVAAAVAAPSTSAAGAARPAGAGPIVFVSNRANGDREIYTVNRDGSGLRRLTYNSLSERQPVWSPDRSRIAFSAPDASGNWDIYTIDANGGDLRRLTTDPARDDSPQWAGNRLIVYQTGAFECPCHGAIVPAGGGPSFVIPTGSMNVLTPAVSAGGDKVAFSSDFAQPGVWAIYVMSLNGHGLKQVTFPTAGMDAQPRFSPAGNDISFVRDNGTQDNDLYVVHANGKGLVQLTNTPNRVEFWSSWSSKDEIVFSAVDSQGWRLYAIPAAGGAETTLWTGPQAPYVENFDSGVIDSSLWHTISDPGGSLSVADGRLVESISGSGTPGGPYNQIDEHIGSQCQLEGDFDYQVDYSLLVWPQFGGVYAGLHAFFANGGVSRQSGPWDPPYNQQYTAWTDSNFNALNTTDTSGTMRLVRVGSTLSAYVMTPAGWQLVNAGDAPNPATIGLGLSANGDQFAHQDASVAYDNFRLNSGSVTCPSWWQDWAPDAG